MVMNVSENSSSTSTATRTAMLSAEIAPDPANDHSVSVTPCSPVSMPQSLESSMFSTTCSGRLPTTTQCGIQKQIPTLAHETVVVHTRQSAVVVRLLHSFCTMLLRTSSVVQMVQLKFNAKLTFRRD